MASDADWSPTVPRAVHVTRESEEATASGIYGVIVSAAVMSASHAEKAYQVIIAVLFTLTIYWGAERYARIVAERIHEGHRPSWTTVRHQLTHGWEMVTASTLPLVVLAVLSVLGAELVTAVLAALVCSTLLLCVAGWAVGRHGRLTPRERVVSTVVAGMFGVVFIVLKTFLH
jgi:drug/metabolite transporter (DMT)-like permease